MQLTIIVRKTLFLQALGIQAIYNTSQCALMYSYSASCAVHCKVAGQLSKQYGHCVPAPTLWLRETPT